MAYALANSLDFDLAGAGEHYSPFRPARVVGAPAQVIVFDLLAAGYATTSYPPRGFFHPSQTLDFSLAVAGTYTAPPRPRVPGYFSESVRLDFSTLAYRSGDAQWLDVVTQDVTFFFPGDMSQVEILYPVIPVNKENTVLAPMGHGGFRVEKKTETILIERESTVRFRVDRGYLATFEGDLHSHRGQIFRLITLGYTPFGINSSDNMVYCLTHTGAKPSDKYAMTFDIDVTFLFISVTP